MLNAKNYTAPKTKGAVAGIDFMKKVKQGIGEVIQDRIGHFRRVIEDNTGKGEVKVISAGIMAVPVFSAQAQQAHERQEASKKKVKKLTELQTALFETIEQLSKVQELPSLDQVISKSPMDLLNNELRTYLK